MRLKDLFIIHNGLASSNVKVRTNVFKDSIMYIRPASTMKRTIAGWVNRKLVPEAKIFPKDTLFVSTDGEGSHSYSYVSTHDFVPNSNVAVLIPKIEMSVPQKLFYAKIITLNRYRFSYGRKPKGERLASINIPALNEIPSWVNDVNLTPFVGAEKPITTDLKIDLDTSDWQEFYYKQLFDIKKGARLTKAKMTKGNTPFIGSTDSNNGLTNTVGQQPIHTGNVITVNYNGSVGESFYQPVPFWASDDVNVLYPKSDKFLTFNVYIALFIIPLIKAEQYRFNYGRKWHTDRMTQSTIKLPIDKSGNLNLAFMESYIKTLPFSSSI